MLAQALLRAAAPRSVEPHAAALPRRVAAPLAGAVPATAAAVLSRLQESKSRRNAMAVVRTPKLESSTTLRIDGEAGNRQSSRRSRSCKYLAQGARVRACTILVKRRATLRDDGAASGLEKPPKGVWWAKF